MQEISASYWVVLAEQVLFISVFLGGISATISGTLILQERKGKLVNFLTLGFSCSALFYIVAIFSMTKLMLLVTPGSPFPDNPQLTIMPRSIGMIFFTLGILTFMVMVSTFGFLKNKSIGIVTSIIGLISLIFILTLLVD